MGRPLAIAVALALAAAAASAAAADTASKYRSTVSQILAQPYQPQYVPQGCDTAFSAGSVLNTAPAQDYTSGSIPGSPDAPAARVVPSGSVEVRRRSAAAASLRCTAATRPA
jgi:hypothetical protein